MAKKKAPQRLAGAEESCISPSMWKKLEELYALYEAAIRAERTRYNVLLAEQKGLPLNAEPDSFAKGSPTRGAGERSETERFNPEFDSSDPQKEAHSDAPAGQ